MPTKVITFWEVYFQVFTISIFVTIVITFLLTNYVNPPNNLKGFILSLLGLGKIILPKYVAKATSDDLSQIPDSIKDLLPEKIKLATEIQALESQDHYIKVYTEIGSEVILLRIKDAAHILRNSKGCRIHRSYWVAFNAIKSITKGKKTNVVMINEVKFPISRSYYDDFSNQYAKWQSSFHKS